MAEKGGMRVFTWDDIKRTTLTPPKVISRVLKKLVRAGFIENLGPNNPKARYRMTLPEELAGAAEERPGGDARRESRVMDREAFDAKYAPMAGELREMAETATNVSRKRIASFLSMKLAKGETEFLRTEWAQEMDIEVSTAEDDVTKTVEYGLTAARHPGPNDLTVYTILPERLKSPVDTDFTVFLKN